MANYNAINYIRNGLKRGVPISNLKNNLLGQGWSREDVEGAAGVVTGTSGTKGFHLNPLVVIGFFGLALIVILFLIFGLPDPESSGFGNNYESYSDEVLGCAEDWDCSSWSVCSEGEKTRTCVDDNGCGTTEIKPSTMRDCYFNFGSGDFGDTNTTNTTNTTSPNATGTTNDDTSVDIVTSFCGDGIVNGTEECEDGNYVDGDGCNSICMFEVCGNGIVDFGEECDGGAGCSSSCQYEFIVPDDDGQIVCGVDGVCRDGGGRVVVPSCGDGTQNISLGEQCDDGNNVSQDGCSSICKFEYCGDEIITLNGNGYYNSGYLPEECDDGNLVNGDGCDSHCLNEAASCGNDILEFGEECDDGNNIDEDGCSSGCLNETLVCNTFYTDYQCESFFNSTQVGGSESGCLSWCESNPINPNYNCCSYNYRLCRIGINLTSTPGTQYKASPCKYLLI